ncbi:uncharacterized protein TNCV_3162641 [Trichonephila clavipes]|nr:uncharacterized protein TNCV_3162641 [Trichonephila clavipes]
MKAAAKSWSRSEACDFRYTTLLSDGDAKTHEFLNNLKINEPDVEILKEECINHVSKMSGTSLRNLVKDWGDKDYLTKIVPRYQRLPFDSLLKGFVRCLTQNSNGNLHSVIWSKCSKETSARSRRVNIAVSEAVSEYNFGTLKVLKDIQNAANLDLGEEAIKIAATRDYKRKKKEIVKERCSARGNWTAAEWNQFDFRDDSRFNLNSDNNRVRLWRPRGERLNPAFVLLRHTVPKAGVMTSALSRIITLRKRPGIALNFPTTHLPSSKLTFHPVKELFFPDHNCNPRNFNHHIQTTYKTLQRDKKAPYGQRSCDELRAFSLTSPLGSLGQN